MYDNERFRLHPILGDTIYEGGDRTCKECGSVEFHITEGKGPHRAGLYCLHCEQFKGWLPAVEVAGLIETLAENNNE